MAIPTASDIYQFFIQTHKIKREQWITLERTALFRLIRDQQLKIIEHFSLGVTARPIDTEHCHALLDQLQQEDATTLVMRHGEQHLSEATRRLESETDKKIAMMRAPDNCSNPTTAVSALESIAFMCLLRYVQEKGNKTIAIQTSHNMRALQPATVLAQFLGTDVNAQFRWDCVDYLPEATLPTTALRRCMPDGKLPWNQALVTRVVGKDAFAAIESYTQQFIAQQKQPKAQITLVVTHSQQVCALLNACSGYAAATADFRLSYFGFVFLQKGIFKSIEKTGVFSSQPIACTHWGALSYPDEAAPQQAALFNVSRECSLTDVASQAQQRVLQSIQKQGLCAYTRIDDKAYTGATLSVSEALCVNYVDLRAIHRTHHAHDRVMDSICTRVMDEEYTGVRGIVIERAWACAAKPSDKAARALFLDEIKQRLQACVVFILRPPTLNRGLIHVHGAPEGVQSQAMVYKDRDGVSQAMGCSLSATPVSYVNVVTEIKTNKRFCEQDMMAAVVPAALVDSVKALFPRLTLYSVPDTTIALTKLPEMNTIMHEERLGEACRVRCPDLKQGLLDYIATLAQSTSPHFALHAVRLPTQYDFTPRFVTGLQAKREQLRSLACPIVQRDGSSDRGWVAVHKHIGLSKAAVSRRLCQYARAHRTHVRVSADIITRPYEHNKDKLYALTGCYQMNTYNKPLSAEQRQWFRQIGGHMCQFRRGYQVISYPKQHADAVKMLLLYPERYKQKLERAATQIQRIFRGFRVRQLVPEYRAQLKKKHDLQRQLDVTQAALDTLGAKLRLGGNA